jgi:hypothetical protein
MANDNHSSGNRGSLGRQAAPDELDLRPLLGVEEVSQLLGVPEATLYRWHSLSTSTTP